jgi:uncharacterized protein (DUF2249 family)
VHFYKYEVGGVEYLQFDSSKTGHPEPMINAMTGLQNLAQNQKLVMINSKAPMGLFPKIENDFSFEVEELDGIFKITFTRKGNENSTNFEDTACSGGGACAH